ncbi:LysR family transcriptional regulator [Herbaspirillum seropedicae]|uniref:LysR family transcription regulator protein n=1 Tax=Herbaspirillum seropedicae (strain SmR1) TaxID=757424 RepID=D8IXY4_HERSS|nr:LysR family transcriptional regulator [Herbaspirillum seropedicae]ADJ66106.1 LysR family transcription regulator protein [Herbaspirillum seropedicae SmR1]AKN67865.1 LysR family transcriptional regulator [Herbaspirillum seropedicae]AON57031.1 LysR family transcription regulator protein [Herbaspirillum seropedicae]NQE29899.1 LysR family transcriptional regulator [Herbaspirillum seropedicae]UMU23902.1 LysR family transcriptional regulator [Herbaspirillum seropedicae]
MDRLMAMQVFVTVVDSGSLSAAAEQLDLSRPVVSRYVAELEDWVGARLLHRTTRRLSLTPAGNELLPRCRQMLEYSEDMRHALDAPDETPRGLLRITASTSFAQTQLIQAVVEYGRRYPGVAVDLLALDRTVNLVEERIDLAIRMTNRLEPNLIARPLGVCRSIICATPDYLARHGLPRKVEDLALHNCLTHSYVGRSLWQFDPKKKKARSGRGASAAKPQSVAVGGSISANEVTVLLQAVLAGVGIGHMPAYTVAPLVASGQLVQLLPDYEPLQLGMYGVYASRKHMPATLRTMLDFLAQRFAGQPF